MQIRRSFALLFLLDLGMGVIYLLNHAAGRPYPPFTAFIDLNGEGNLPTWYSSILWFCVAALLGIFALRHCKLAEIRSWLLAALPLVFLALSLDEIAQIHEWWGARSDALLPGSSRKNTMFSGTGIWMFVLGIPFVILFTALIASTRAYFRGSRGALIKVGSGMAVTLVGALGLESLCNFVAPGSHYSALQAFAEEVSEMLGATLLLWAGYDLAFPDSAGEPAGRYKPRYAANASATSS